MIERLIAAGLDSIPGGGAEILVDRVRKLLNCYGKASADEWLDVMRHAHRAGLRTTATMMYGTVETMEERLEHLLRLRELQDETGGFTAFITWSYQPEHTERGGREATGLEYLRTLAIARLVLDNFDNLQASWVTQGGKVGQLSLAFGANDMGSVMIEENVVRAAGASYCMDEVEIVRNIEDAGFVAKRRNMHYDILGDPMFRLREVPRMLELATARADGDTLGAGGAPQLSGAQRRRQAAARAGPVNPRPHDACSGRRGSARSRSRRSATAGLPSTDGRIVAWSARRVKPRRRSRRAISGRVAVLPGLVNAHTHLELSWLRGRVPPAAELRRLDQAAVRRRAAAASSSADDPAVLDAARRRRARRARAGTVGGRRHQQLARDRRADSRRRPARRRVSRAARVQRRRRRDRSTRRAAIGDAAAALAADRCACRCAPHAPYSVSPELFRAIRDEVDRSAVPITSVHLGESAGEVEFLARRQRAVAGMLRLVGSMPRRTGQPPGCGPVEYLDGLGVLDARTLVVHGVQLTTRALDRLAAIGCTLVTCPRSNQWVGVGVPPVRRFYASGVRVAVGTDSLASVEDLNLFSELKTMRWLAPAVPARPLLESATLRGRRGARASATSLGSIEAASAPS